MKDRTKAEIGALAAFLWRPLSGFAWGSAVSNVDNWFSRALLLTFGALWATDKLMGAWWVRSDDAKARRAAKNVIDVERVEISGGVMNGVALDATEARELAAFIDRVQQRRKRPPSAVN